jgi:hypothetical protein
VSRTKQRTTRRLTRAILHATIVLPLPVLAQLPGPRDLLSFKDSGLYCGWTPYFTQSNPFDFCVVPAIPYQGQSNAAWAGSLTTARAAGKRVIADLNPQALNASGQWFGISELNDSSTDADLNKLVTVIDQFFAQVNVNDVYAITLGEENYFWNSRTTHLNALYDKIKAKYNVPIYQWYGPSSIGTAPGISGFYNLKSDGWMADEYFLDQPNMEKNMRAYAIQQKPFVQTIWAGGDAASVPFSSSRFYSQYEVLKKYNIPASYFTWNGTGGYWGFESGAPAPLKQRFELVKANATAAQSYTGPDTTSWDQVPWKIPTIELALSSISDTTPSYSENYVSDRVLRFVNDARIKGFENVRWDSSAVQLRPRKAGAAQSSVTYNFSSAFPVSQLHLNAAGFITPGKSAAVSFSVLDSAGKLIQTSNLTAGGTVSLNLSGTHFVGREFKIVYNMSGVASGAGDVLAGVSSIDVSADVVLPKQKPIQALPTVSDAVNFQASLSSMSIFQTATFHNPGKVQYSSEGMLANTNSGSLEAIQSFIAPRNMTLSTLTVSGQAIQSSFGARFGVGISLDGTNMLATQYSSGDYNGDVTLNVGTLASQIKSKQVYVHLLLDGSYGVITSYGFNGTAEAVGAKNDFGTAAQRNDLLWFNSATPATYSTSLPASVQITSSAADLPAGSSFTASDLTGDGQARNLYMTGGASPSDVRGIRPVSADPFKVFNNVSVSAQAAAGSGNFAANATGVILAQSRTGNDLANYATNQQMQLVSVNGGATFNGASRFWAGARISNANASVGPDGWYASRLTDLQVSTDQREPHAGERVLLTNNDFGTASQQSVWTKTGSATVQYFSSNAGDVSNDLLANGIQFAGTTETQRTGDLSLVLEIDAPAGRTFKNVIASADAWAFASWGSATRLMLSRDGTNFDILGNLATPDVTTISASTNGTAGYESLSSVWLKIYMSDAFGFQISGNYLRVQNLLVTGEMNPAVGSRWGVGASGDWNDAANWYDGVPNAADAAASFLDSITTPQTIYTNLAVTLGSLRFDNSARYVLAGAGTLTMDVSFGKGSIDVVSGSHSINLPLSLADSTDVNVGTTSTLTLGNPVTQTGGTTLTKNGSGTLVIASTLKAPAPATLKINGGVVTLAATNNDPDISINVDPATLNITSDQTLGEMTLSLGGNVLNLGTADTPASLTVSRLVVAGGDVMDTVQFLHRDSAIRVAGALEIKDNSHVALQNRGTLIATSLVVSASSQLDLGPSQLLVDYTGASPGATIRALLSSDRIMSSLAVDSDYALGYADSAVSGPLAFNGGFTDSTAVLIGFTLKGDATLDGTVNSLDFNAFASGYGQATEWYRGDFNYDGKVNTQDFNYLAGNFGRTAAAPVLGAVVPEPASSLMLALLPLARLARRRSS